MQAIAAAELPSRISHEKVLVVFGGLLLVMLSIMPAQRCWRLRSLQSSWLRISAGLNIH